MANPCLYESPTQASAFIVSTQQCNEQAVTRIVEVRNHISEQKMQDDTTSAEPTARAINFSTGR